MTLKEILDCASYAAADIDSFQSTYDEAGSPLPKDEESDCLAELVVRQAYSAYDASDDVRTNLSEIMKYLDASKAELEAITSRLEKVHNLLIGADSK